MGTDDHAFPVLDGGRFVGLVTLDDVRKLSRAERETATVRDVMTPANQLLVAQPNKEASEARNKITRRDVRQLPVLQNGQLIDLLRRRDIVRWLQVHSKLEPDAAVST